jgi:manganese transport protein
MTICGLELPATPFKARPWIGLAGPAFVIGIGYIDPGNWATDIAAGSFGFRLLWVVLLANLMAVALQIAVVRLAAITGIDLATAMARRWARAAPMFWLVFQTGAVATDFAEFGGVVLGLHLLFGWSTSISVAVGIVAVFAVLFLGRRESRGLEMTMIAVLAGVAFVFTYYVSLLHPSSAAVIRGLLPQLPSTSAIPIVVAIIGATVMPHNLFLHSALVVRSSAAEPQNRERSARFFSRETWVALSAATLVNGAILVFGGSLSGHNGSIEAAFHSVVVAEGGAIALLFGGGLLASAVAATATATLAGDYVFGALAPWRLSSLSRRVLTLAPAAALILCGAHIADMLVWSQVVLALILPLVVIPMLLEYARVHHSLGIASGRQLFIGASAAGGLCIAFDGALFLQPLIAHYVSLR